MGPTTNYVKNGDVHIAYQTLGAADRDLVYLAGIFSHIELFEDHGVHELKGVPERWQIDEVAGDMTSTS